MEATATDIEIEVRYNVNGEEIAERYIQDATGYGPDELSDVVLDYGTPLRPRCDWDELVGVRRVG